LIELILEHQNGKEHLSENTLVIAIDDTGHEEFKDSNYQVFGLGGCAFLVRDYQRLIEKPWNYMCKRFFPEIERPMHAAKLSSLSQEQLDALKHFFEKFEFFRIAATASIKSVKEVDSSFIELVGASLLQRICDIGKWADFDRVVIIFEESERIEMKVIQSLSGKKIKRNESEIKIELGLIPKSASVPALEVADFIIHTAGAQTRSRNLGNKKVRKDFEIVFRNVDERLVSFIEITSAVAIKNA
jgi:hypothetical protein